MRSMILALSFVIGAAVPAFADGAKPLECPTFVGRLVWAEHRGGVADSDYDLIVPRNETQAEPVTFHVVISERTIESIADALKKSVGKTVSATGCLIRDPYHNYLIMNDHIVAKETAE